MTDVKLNRVLAFLSLAILWACDGSGGRNAAGQPAACGNGRVEAGEACDDGNVAAGDGCDATCQAEVDACDAVIDYRIDPAPGSELTISYGELEAGAPGRIAGSCGGGGGEKVFGFSAERKGLLYWVVANAAFTDFASGLGSYVLAGCGLDVELTCVPPRAAWAVVEILEPGEVLIVVDAPAPVGADVPFALGTQFVAFKDPGEGCDPSRREDVCVAGHVCTGTPAVCREGTAPVIEKGATVFDGDPAYVIAAGTDLEEDVVGFWIEALGDDGEPMAILDLDRDGTPESSRVYLDNAELSQSTYGMTGFFGNGDGTWSAVVPTHWSQLGFALWDPAIEVPRIRLTLRDSAGLSSEPLAFGPPVEAAPGEACDRRFVVCAEGVVCRGEPAVCVEGTAPAITRALYADRGEARGGPRLLVEGVDPDDDVAFVRVETLDEAGNVTGFDTNGDGAIDESDLTAFELPVVAGGGTFGGALDLAAGIPGVALTPVDATDREGDRVVLSVVPYAWRQVGESCDGSGWESCDLGLKCEGEPPVCVQGTAPVIEGAAFAADAEGPRLLLLVADPDDDVALVQLTLLDANGQPARYDLFGDGEPWGPVLDLPISDYPFACADGRCFADFVLIDGFLGVPGLGFQAFDATGLSSAAVPVTYGPLPTRARGEACSTWGFDVCEAGTTCAGTPATCR